MSDFTTISMSENLYDRLGYATTIRNDVSEQWIWKMCLKKWERLPKEERPEYNKNAKYYTGKSISGIRKEFTTYGNNKLRFILNWYLEDFEEKIQKIPPLYIEESDRKWYYAIPTITEGNE